MMVLVDPRTHLAVQPGDISAMRICRAAEGGEYLLLCMTSGCEFKVYGELSRSDPKLNIRDLHQRLMEESK
ncbi:hypothetical protein HDC32_001620 [Pseudomonas sp. JAI120]|nr:hypothetical protein [Pseudomonas sp. SJZ073]MBB6311951.1 hypothetical protein [Pseudomonas sp. JAI120]